jgi:AraC-like DNA-binding protein
VSTDTLSDVLRAVRLTAAVFFDIEAKAPWVAEAPAACEVASLVLPNSEHVIEYHLVCDGNCYGGLIGEPALSLSTGDLIIFPLGDAHVLSSAPGMRGQPDLAVHHRPPGVQLPIRLHEGGQGERVSLICGFLGCDARPFNPLLSTLPRTMVVRQEHLAEKSSSTFSSLSELVKLAVAESKVRRPGGECALSRLSELLFVEAIRAYVETLPVEQSGWLAGLRDPHVGRALALLHDRPADAWSIEELAHQVGLSKSLLMERFVHYVGVPPIQYLTQWRMQLAAERLRSTTDSLAQIADRIGYGSESAFSRAFKRIVGVAPANFRQVGLSQG